MTTDNEPISDELRPITDALLEEFPALVEAFSFPLDEDFGESAAELIPHRFPKCPLLLIYSNGTYYVGVGRRYSYDSEDYHGADHQAWLLDIVQRIARFGVYRVARKTLRNEGGGTVWLPEDEGEFCRVFQDPKALITIESMPWRGFTVRAD